MSENMNYAKLGFEPTTPVATLPSIAHLFGSSKNRCGIYLLEFSRNRFYIGQAIDAVRRFSQHRKNYDDIVGFSFLPVRRPLLDETEKDLIFKAEKLGLVILNTVHASNVAGDSDLDMVLSKDEQDAWLASPKSFNKRDASPIIELPNGQVERSLPSFRKFQEQSERASVIRLLKIYIDECIPAPKRTEYSFWSLSCMPATNATTWPRLVSINLGVMEVFVLGHFKGKPNNLWGFVNLSSDVLPVDLSTAKKIEKAFPSIEVVNRNYRDAGQHQFSLHAGDQESLTKLMANPDIKRAAATLALRVMRKRPTIYGKFHCKQLANTLLDDERVSDPHS